MYELLYSLVSVLVVSLISLVGLAILPLNEKNLKHILLYLVSFSAGALLGDAFIHLIPEVSKNGFTTSSALFIMLGIIVSFIVEKFIYWRHCHIPTSKNHPHSFAYMNLIGDGVHNLLDGLIIGGSFITNFTLGITTTIAVILHEIPQEIGDFGVLVYGGFSRVKALIYNFITAMSAFIGVLVAFLFEKNISNFSEIIIPFAAGEFIYIACSDLIPELHKEVHIKNSLIQLASLLIGIAMMALLLSL
ncbi:ZIP family metal transporter [Candidatus Woesearchaeota archaeon]|nr:ZIP family metal transporter [Candidatus Woesearchaeota archaeon]